MIFSCNNCQKDIKKGQIDMGGFKDDIDDLDDDLDLDTDGADDDDYGFDDEEGGSSKKSKGEGSGFNRDAYYLYKDKLVQLTGTVRPKERTKEGKVVSLDFKTQDKIYTVVMDVMGQKLLSQCFQELLVTGQINKVTDKEFTLTVKTFI